MMKPLLVLSTLATSEVFQYNKNSVFVVLKYEKQGFFLCSIAVIHNT